MRQKRLLRELHLLQWVRNLGKLLRRLKLTVMIVRLYILQSRRQKEGHAILAVNCLNDDKGMVKVTG